MNAWMNILQNKTFGFDADGHVSGKVNFIKFDRFGNPVYYYTQTSDKKAWSTTTYISYHNGKEKWVYYDYVDFFDCFYQIKHRDPLDVINVREFPNPPGSVCRGLYSTFELIREKCQFIEYGTERNYRKFLKNILLCINRTIRLPLEIVFMIMNFLRIVEIENQDFYPLIQIKWNGI